MRFLLGDGKDDLNLDCGDDFTCLEYAKETGFIVKEVEF